MVVVFVLMIGMALGSFVNMLVYRTAIKYKIKNTRSPPEADQPLAEKIKAQKRQKLIGKLTKEAKWSFCDYCGKPLSWFENIPVISWVLQGGRTRCCNRQLPIAYPLLELGMGGVLISNFKFLISNDWLVAGNVIDMRLAVVALLEVVILTLMVFGAVFDAKYLILPDFSNAWLLGLAVARWLLNWPLNWGYPLAGLVAGAVVLGLYLITRGKGMGMGDVKYAPFMGMYLGLIGLAVGLYVAFISGAMYGVGLILSKKAKMKSVIPFGPFLIGGTVVSAWWGRIIMDWVTKVWF